MKSRGLWGWLAIGVLSVLLGGCAGFRSVSAGARPAAGGVSAMSEKAVTSGIAPAGKEIATLAGGCFWCTEAIFKELKGVEAVMPGYAGGGVENPTYEEVCSGTTGHAEAVQILFDPKQLSFADLLRVFFTLHDPTTLNRQGADVGTQYRSAIFFHSKEQEATARQVIQEFDNQHVWKDPIVTEVTPFSNFYPAEDYHRDYYAQHHFQPYCMLVIDPKMSKLRDKFAEKLIR